MPTLAVLDIDGTLCASPPVPRRAGQPDFRGWTDRMAARGHELPPTPGAAHAARVAAALPVVLVTARLRRLEDVTRAWLTRHAPALSRAPLRMRPPRSVVPSANLRAAQLRAIWEEHGEPQLLVLDDQPIASSLPGLRIYRAPDEWSAFAAACETAISSP